MITTTPQWPYLVQIDDTISLLPAESSDAEPPLGDYCGEWGSYIGESGKPAGVRLMFALDYIPRDSNFTQAKNIREQDGDLIILFQDSRLPDAEMCPLLPVYRAVHSDGREILQLSGYG